MNISANDRDCGEKMNHHDENSCICNTCGEKEPCSEFGLCVDCGLKCCMRCPPNIVRCNGCKEEFCPNCREKITCKKCEDNFDQSTYCDKCYETTECTECQIAFCNDCWLSPHQEICHICWKKGHKKWTPPPELWDFSQQIIVLSFQFLASCHCFFSWLILMVPMSKNYDNWWQGWREMDAIDDKEFAMLLKGDGSRCRCRQMTMPMSIRIKLK